MKNSIKIHFAIADLQLLKVTFSNTKILMIKRLEQVPSPKPQTEEMKSSNQFTRSMRKLSVMVKMQSAS